jgi:hypothetical protein
MSFHVLFIADDRPEPHYFATLDADDDDQARRLVAETWPGEDDLALVREDGDRLVRVPKRVSERPTPSLLAPANSSVMSILIVALGVGWGSHPSWFRNFRSRKSATNPGDAKASTSFYLRRSTM